MPDLPDEVKEHLKFHFVSNVDEVLKIAVDAAASKPANGKLKPAPAVKSSKPKPIVKRSS